MLAKTKLNSRKVLISTDWTDSYIIHDEFVLVNDVLKEHDDMKEEIKNLKASKINQRFKSIYKTMLSYCLKCRKKTESKTRGLQKQSK